MRIGVFGGSFDPPHAAHVQVAEAGRTQLKLDRVIWVPAFHPPHKDVPVTAFEHRAGMVRSLTASDSTAEVSEIESSLPRPSYTLHTIQALKSLKGPGHSWHLLLGADNWAIFQNWHRPDVVMAEASIAVYPRQGISLTALPEGVTLLDCPEIPLESGFFRRQFRVNPGETLAKLPVSVADYILKHGLYGLSSAS